MKKHLALTVLILIVLSIMVSCGEDPFFHSITIKNDGETLGTETVRNGSKYTLPKEYKGIENLSGWTIDDDETVYDPGQEITVTKNITINAYTVQPYFDYNYLEDYGWEVTLLDEYRDTVTDVVIPSSHEGEPVVYVDKFDNATNLVSVTVPSSVLVINGFNNCTKLERITFKEDSQLMVISGFYKCTSLKSIVIPKSVTGLGDGCFSNCTSLESVTFEEGSLLRIIGKDGCFENTKITSITLPEGLESIGAGCFEGCSELTSIFIPNSVYEMDYDVFSNINANAVITIDRVKNSIVENQTYDWGTPSTVKITWTGKTTTYTVTYDPNGATGESYTTEVKTYGDSITIDNCPTDWVKEGHTFDGWHQREDGDTAYSKDYAAGETYSGPTTTFYAQWKKN